MLKLVLHNLPMSQRSRQLVTSQTSAISSVCTSTHRCNHIRPFLSTSIPTSPSPSKSPSSRHIQPTANIYSPTTLKPTTTSSIKSIPKSKQIPKEHSFSTTTRLHLDIKIPTWDPNRSSPNRGWRLAYFGSDHFSQIVLKALNEVKHEEPDLIEYIKVYCLPEGRSGRGMIRERLSEFFYQFSFPLHLPCFDLGGLVVVWIWSSCCHGD